MHILCEGVTAFVCNILPLKIIQSRLCHNYISFSAAPHTYNSLFFNHFKQRVSAQRESTYFSLIGHQFYLGANQKSLSDHSVLSSHCPLFIFCSNNYTLSSFHLPFRVWPYEFSCSPTLHSYIDLKGQFTKKQLSPFIHPYVISNQNDFQLFSVEHKLRCLESVHTTYIP